MKIARSTESWRDNVNKMVCKPQNTILVRPGQKKGWGWDGKTDRKSWPGYLPGAGRPHGGWTVRSRSRKEGEQRGEGSAGGKKGTPGHCVCVRVSRRGVAKNGSYLPNLTHRSAMSPALSGSRSSSGHTLVRSRTGVVASW